MVNGVLFHVCFTASPFDLQVFGYFPSSGKHSLNSHSHTSYISFLICEVVAIMIGQASLY